MPFYIRKSIAAGPFRFNFSKGGVGASVGVRGLRIGTGPRGHYVHAGVGGIYYRSSIGRAGARRRDTHTSPKLPQESPQQSDVVMREIDSGDVMEMRDETFGELLDEINNKNKQVKMSVAFCWLGIIVGLIVGLAFGGPGLILTFLGLPGWAIGRWLDSYRRSTVLFYDLEGDAEDAYERLTQGFDGLLGCAGKWHIAAGGAITNLTAWKRNAGASHLVKKSATTLSYLLPTVIKSNVTPPVLAVGAQRLFFMPDIILVQDRGQFGAVPYSELTLTWQDSRFIEDGWVPSDARVVGHTWKHPNKNGGPDRRFRDNRQIPICLYETIHLRSGSGLNELVEFSQTGKAAAFHQGCQRLAGLPKATATQSLPALSFADLISTSERQATAPKRHPVRKLLLVPAAVIVGLSAIGIFVPNRPTELGSPAASSATISLPTTDISKISTIKPGPSGELVPAVQTASPSVITEPAKAADILDKKNTASARTAVNLREGPATTYRVITVVRKDTSVQVLAQSGRWAQVDIGDGKIGWMASEFLSSN